MPESLDMFRYWLAIPANEFYGSNAKLASADDLRFELAGSKQHAFAYGHLSARSYQCFPSAFANRFGQKHLDRPCKVCSRCCPRWALGMYALAPPEQPRGNDSGIVEHQ